MTIVNAILRIPFLWTLSQKIFGCDEQKKHAYRSAFKQPCTILDFGCANGNTFDAFRDFTYYGVDIDEQLISNAQKKFAAYPNAHFVCADICKKPFPDEFFDAILFGATGHHLDDALFERVIQALCDMLKIGGSIHFFDIIRSPKDSSLLTFLIDLDQGKFVRTEERYRTWLPSISKKLRPTHITTNRISGTPMPQPVHFYAEMKRVASTLSLTESHVIKTEVQHPSEQVQREEHPLVKAQ